MDSLQPPSIEDEDVVVGGAEFVADAVRIQDTGPVVKNLARWAPWELFMDAAPLRNAESPSVQTLGNLN